jgi:hypothetical protein
MDDSLLGLAYGLGEDMVRPAPLRCGDNGPWLGFGTTIFVNGLHGWNGC